MSGNYIVFATPGCTKFVQDSLRPKLLEEDGLGRVLFAKSRGNELRVALEDNVRGSTAFVISPGLKAADIQESTFLGSTLKQASAARVVMVYPYLGYSRASVKIASRTSVGAGIVKSMIGAAYPDRYLLFDYRARAIFDSDTRVQSDHLGSAFLAIPKLAKLLPDTGFVLAPIDRDAQSESSLWQHFLKKRSREGTLSTFLEYHDGCLDIETNLEGKWLVLHGDIIEHPTQFMKMVRLARTRGAAKVLVWVTHAPSSGRIWNMLLRDKLIDSFLTTDSIGDHLKLPPDPRVEVTSVADMIAEAIRSIHNNESVSKLIMKP